MVTHGLGHGGPGQHCLFLVRLLQSQLIGADPLAISWAQGFYWRPERPMPRYQQNTLDGRLPCSCRMQIRQEVLGRGSSPHQFVSSACFFHLRPRLLFPSIICLPATLISSLPAHTQTPETSPSLPFHGLMSPLMNRPSQTGIHQQPQWAWQRLAVTLRLPVLEADQHIAVRIAKG